MNSKMRVGHKHSDGKWSGAIGAYLSSKQIRAESFNAGREEGRRSAPGENTIHIRERLLRVLAAVADEHGVEWIHKLEPEHWVTVKIRVIAEASTDNRVRGELKSSTIASYVRGLCAFARFCADKDYISPKRRDSILEYLPVPEEDYTRFVVIPSVKWPSMFEAAAKRHMLDTVVIALGLYLLMRESEMSRLTWSCFDWEESTVTFKRDKKNGASLTAPLCGELVVVLKEWQTWLLDFFNVDEIPGDWPVLMARPKKCGDGFGRTMRPSWPVEVRPILADTVQTIAKLAAMAAGYTDEQLLGQAVHLLRRSGAEDLMQRGWDIRIISELLGHGKPGKPNIEQTMRYLGHWVDLDKMRAAVNRQDPNEIRAKELGGSPGSELALREEGDEARSRIAAWVASGDLTLDEGLKFAALVARG